MVGNPAVDMYNIEASRLVLKEVQPTRDERHQ
jgi:hypothetical protein